QRNFLVSLNDSIKRVALAQKRISSALVEVAQVSAWLLRNRSLKHMAVISLPPAHSGRGAYLHLCSPSQKNHKVKTFLYILHTNMLQLCRKICYHIFTDKSQFPGYVCHRFSF